MQAVALWENISANAFLDAQVEMGLGSVLTQSDSWIKNGQ